MMVSHTARMFECRYAGCGTQRTRGPGRRPQMNIDHTPEPLLEAIMAGSCDFGHTLNVPGLTVRRDRLQFRTLVPT